MQVSTQEKRSQNLPDLYRVEIRFPQEVRESLETLRQEASERKGKRVSMNDLIVGIVSDFLKVQ